MDNVKTKGGRPKKTIKRKAATGIRFTEMEYHIVKNKAASAGLKLTVYVRQMAIQGHVYARLTGEEKQQIKALAGIANNINQMAKKANAEGLLKTSAVFLSLLQQLEEILGRAKA